ncbi:MAG: hypothetical protein ACFFD7_09550, partial [Candidatus Thorarchaeota archaeon]
TVHTVKLLNLEQEKNNTILKLSAKIMKESKIGIISSNNSTKLLDAATALDSARLIIDNLEEDSSHVVINGAITDKLLEDLIKSIQKYRGITFLVSDATTLFLSKKILKKFQKKVGSIKVLNPIKIIAVTINPTSPDGYEFDKDDFLKSLAKEVNIPVYNLGVND